MVEKEAKAVNSEYEIDVSGDGWKLMHLVTLLSNEKHPLSRFTIGNLNSLLQDDSKLVYIVLKVCQELKRFFQDYYSSNLMALVVKSSLGLDDLEHLVRTSDFSKIPN
jgi:insulysin